MASEVAGAVGPPLGEMDLDEFRRAGHRIVDWIADYRAHPECYPVEVARLVILEKDERALATGAAALQAFQRGCSDSAIVAGNHPGIQAGGTSGRLTGSPYGREGTGGIGGAARRARGG